MSDDVWIGWGLVMYGQTMRYDTRPNAELGVMPAGETDPPGDYWRARYDAAGSEDERVVIVEQARVELRAWLVRPEPPPEGETLDELIDRVIAIGEGWEAGDVALALRCTPTFVRRARVARDRSPTTGRVEGSLENARELLERGLSLRQVAMLTGIPKSTLHEALNRAA